jgi:hypothetical protein
MLAHIAILERMSDCIQGPSKKSMSCQYDVSRNALDHQNLLEQMKHALRSNPTTRLGVGCLHSCTPAC